MKRLKSIALAALAVLMTTVYVLPASEAAAQGSASLSIVPKKNYTVEPGKTVNDKLTIRNLDNEQTLNLTLRVVDFTYNDDSGAPKLMLAEDAPQTAWSLKPYLTVPKTVTIEPRSSQTLDMSVNVPANQGAGSLYSAIVYSTGSADGGNVGLSASGVTLVFASIPGKVNEKLTLEKLGAYSTGNTSDKVGYKWFATEEPKQIAYTLKNEGNVTEAPAGTILVKHMFGKEYTIDKINPNSSLALIGQTRTFTSCLKQKAEDVDFNGSRSEATSCTQAGLWPGYYSVSASMFYGQNGNNTQELNGTGGFWYMPMWFIIILVIVLLAIALAVWMLIRKIRGPGATKFARRK